ncbi:MAG: MarC family protein [Pseudomonadota bacterium]
MLHWVEYTKLLAGLFAIIDPISIVPLFLVITSAANLKEKREIISLCALSMSVILIFTLVSGEFIMWMFGISIQSFSIAGGVILVLIAMSMVTGKPVASYADKQETSNKSLKSLAVVPLAIPLLSGPGAISTVLVYAHKHESLFHYLIILCAIISIAMIIFILLRSATKIEAFLGKTGMDVVARLMGLITLAIGIEFIAQGILEFFPGLK